MAVSLTLQEYLYDRRHQDISIKKDRRQKIKEKINKIGGETLIERK